MDANFIGAFVKSEHYVLRRKLHPLCLANMLVLGLLENPFVAEEPATVFTASDLREAVTVCSLPPLSFMRGEFNPTRLDKAHWWIQSYGLNFRDECQKFVDYLQAFNCRPKFWQDEGGGSLKAPWILATVCHLLHTTTLALDAIWLLPIDQAQWYSAGIAEQMGTSRSELVSEEEETALAELGIEV